MARRPSAGEKPLYLVGSSKRDLLAFPEPAKDHIGTALSVAQFGGNHPRRSRGRVRGRAFWRLLSTTTAPRTAASRMSSWSPSGSGWHSGIVRNDMARQNSEAKEAVSPSPATSLPTSASPTPARGKPRCGWRSPSTKFSNGAAYPDQGRAAAGHQPTEDLGSVELPAGGLFSRAPHAFSQRPRSGRGNCDPHQAGFPPRARIVVTAA